MPIHIIFDGPSSHESGRFIEVEDDNGKSICIGEWNHTPGKLWELVIPDYKAERDALAAENVQLRETLESIRCLDPDMDTAEGYGEAGEAVCYHLARDIADAALAQPPTASPSAPEGVSGDSEPKP